MAQLEPFLVLAFAVAEGRMSALDFSKVCLPLYKNWPGPFPSTEHYEAAAELFYVAHDHDPLAKEGDPDVLTDEQVRLAALKIAERMRGLLQ